MGRLLIGSTQQGAAHILLGQNTRHVGQGANVQELLRARDHEQDHEQDHKDDHEQEHEQDQEQKQE